MHEYVYVYEYVYVPKVVFNKKCLKQKAMTITPESVLIIDENNACLKGDNNKYTQKMKKVRTTGRTSTAWPCVHEYVYVYVSFLYMFQYVFQKSSSIKSD